jgi:hypothetical protein
MVKIICPGRSISSASPAPPLDRLVLFTTAARREPTAYGRLGG